MALKTFGLFTVWLSIPGGPNGTNYDIITGDLKIHFFKSHA